MNVTIVTAAFNAENLPKVIESIDNQTYKDWEHLIVNDNSEAIREMIHDEYISEQIFNKLNRRWIDIGVRTHYYGALARNIGAIVAFSYIHHSKRDIENEWIIFHDDDNFWEPNHLESIVETLEANPKATMIATDAIWIGANDKTWKQEMPFRLSNGKCDLGQFAYKTKLFREYGYFFPDIICHNRRYYSTDHDGYVEKEVKHLSHQTTLEMILKSVDYPSFQIL